MKKIEMKKFDMKKIDVKGSVRELTKKVKDSYQRPLAIAIAAALILTAAGAGTCSVISAHRTKTVQAMRAYVDSADLQEQDETVYVIADADGGVKKVIVSDWLKDSSKNNTIAEVKNLDELEQSDAENGYTINADNANSWDADGGSYYENVATGSDLPIDVKLSYSLDGKKMTANEIAGKSGKVTIRFDYTNNQKQTVSIDGKNTDIYVPFTVVTGTILDGDSFKNVEVSNGKVVNDGSRSIVLGFALPGMQESLALEGNDSPDLPNYVEITADVTNFELTTTLTMVSNDFFNQAVNEADEKKGESSLSLDSLSNGINQLVNGSASLYDGTSQLLDKSSLLIEGVNQLADGGKELKDGVVTLNAALAKICSNNSAINSGIEDLFNGVLVGINSSLDALGEHPVITRDNYATYLPSIIQGIGGQAQTLSIQYSQMLAALSPAQQSQLTESETTEEPTEEDIPQPTEEISEQDDSEQTEAPSVTEPSQSETSGETAEEIPAAQEEPSTDEPSAPPASGGSGVSVQQIDQIATMKATIAKLQDAQSSLSSSLTILTYLDQIWTGVEAYTSGVAQVRSGSDQLAEGAAELSSGLNQLQDSSGALVDGISQLNNGAMQLSEGMQQLSGSNLAKLLGASSGVSLANINARFDAMRDVSASYNSYTGNSGEGGSVKFIYRTDSVSADSSK